MAKFLKARGYLPSFGNLASERGFKRTLECLFQPSPNALGIVLIGFGGQDKGRDTSPLFMGVLGLLVGFFNRSSKNGGHYEQILEFASITSSLLWAIRLAFVLLTFLIPIDFGFPLLHYFLRFVCGSGSLRG